MSLRLSESLAHNSDAGRSVPPSAGAESSGQSTMIQEKYKLLKRHLKEMSERNEMLAQDLSRAKKRLRRLAREKSVLLDRICQYGSTVHIHDVDRRLEMRNQPDDLDGGIDDSESTLSGSVTETETSAHTPLRPTTAEPSQPFETPEPVPVKMPSMLPVQPHPPPTPVVSWRPPTIAPPPPTMQLSDRDDSPFNNSPLPSTSNAQPRLDVILKDGRMVPSSRPKRMRRGPSEPKMRRVQPLERDPTSGEYKLPARVGILTVHSLGRVVPLPTYHNDRYIWPPGFKVSRTYLSMVNPNTNTVYTCSVEENGEQGPKFRVVADDCPDQPIVANSATGVWTAIVKRANEIRNRDHSNSASGPDYYGFTHATIAKMIQDLPGADQCLNYVWQKFGVMQQRTAAGVAAAAQKKLTNLEIMGSANKRVPQSYIDELAKDENAHSKKVEDRQEHEMLDTESTDAPSSTLS